MTDRTGKCLCGAVKFTIADAPVKYGACHCEMCRRWTGSALLAMTVPGDSIAWEGEAHIRTLQSSDWAERAWCQRCGSGLYYHVTVGEMSANYEIPVGLFDDTSGLTLASEIYVDHRIDSAVFAGERNTMTRQEVLAKFGIPDEGAPA